MMIGMKGSVRFALTRRATSMPLISGIITSSRIRSGGSFSIYRSAAAPSWTASVRYPQLSSRTFRTSMLSSWSSTTRMRDWDSGGSSDSGSAPAGRVSSAGILGGVLPEEPLDFRNHRAWLAGLGEIPVTPDLHRLLAVGGEGVGREGDDRDVPGHRVVLEDLRRLPTIDDRDRDIHQDQVGPFGSSLGDPLLAVQRLRHF